MSNNPWQYKPWWCQPWSIVLTGTSLILGAWWLSHHLWLTALVAAPVLVWMGFFVLVWPTLMRKSGFLEQLAAEKATAGVPTSPPPEP
ncbi:hypothetical protein GS597_08320 [Synechococcales cyanobacterium C]|uniref:DUF6737 domain-containing protein n=1 Tax=Petrachloros mirabilis ULC683 TaxID=2781853 RepID=A0A8K2A751_9CYAN|nr:DUF6737 family protein [Petrachloros mirabilis]NCJ06516.1 hypothetical protein [Petrachloros mirabilis ULC683]